MADNNTVSLLFEVKSKLDELQKTVQGLKQVGEVGEQSAKRVSDAQQKELGIIQQLQGQLKELEDARDSANDVESIKAFNEEISKTEKQIQNLTETTPGVAGQLKDIAATAADFTILAAGIGELAGQIKDLAVQAFESVKGIAEQDNALNNLSQTTGASKEAIVAVQNELVKLGESADSVKGAFAQFDGFLAGALADPLGEAGGKAKLLGIDLDAVSNASNKLDTALKQAGTALNPLTLSLEQSAAAAAAFGEDDFAGLVPALENLDEKIQKVQSRGQIITPEQSETAEKLFNNLGDITASIEGLTTQILAELLPATTNILSLVKEQTETLSKDSIAGLKAGISEIGRTLEAIAPIIIGTSKFLVQFAGDFGTAISAILNPFETLNFLITGNSSAVDKAKVSNENLNEVYKAASIAVDKLTSDLEKLTNEQNIQAQTAELNAEKQKLFIDRLLLAGTISEQEAANRKAAIDADLLEKKTANAFEALNVVKNTIEQEGQLRQSNVNKFIAEEKRLADEKSKALQDLERERIASNERIFQAEKNLAKEINKLGAEKAIENFEQLKNKERQIVEDKRQVVETLSDLEKGAANNKIKAAKEADDFQKAINLKEKVDAGELTDELIKLREQYSKARNDFDKSDLAQRKQNFETEKADIESNAASQIKALQDVSSTREAEIKKQIALVDQAEQAGTISRQQAAEKRIALSRQVLDEELSSLDKILASTQLTSDQREQLENRRKELISEIDQLQIDGSAKVREAIIADINAEIAALNKRKEAVEQEKKEIEDKRKVQASAFQQAQNEFNAVAVLADRANSAVAALKGGLVTIGESFDIASQSTEQLQDRILQIEGSIKFLREQVVAPGIDVFINSQIDALTKLNEEVVNRTQRAQLQAQAERARQEEQAARERAAKELEIEREKEEKLREAREERKEQLLDIQEDIDEENERFADREKDRAEKLAEDKTKAEENFRKREEELAEEAERREIERVERLKQLKEDTALDTEDKLNQILRDNLTKRAQLQAQIEAENDPKKKKALQEQLANLTKEGNAKEEREKRKQAEIEKLLSENLSEEELKARKEAIERRFDLEEEADEQRQELIKSGNQKALAEFDKLVEEQKKRDEERLAKELERIKEQAKRKEEQAKKEREQRQAELDQRLKDLQDNYDKEKSDEESRHRDRLAQLQKQQDEIKKQYKETVGKIVEENRKAQEALVVAANSAGEAFASSFDKGIEKAEKFNKLLDETQNKLNNIGNNSGDQSSSTSNNNSSSSSSPNNPPSNPSNNPFSSPNQGDNNGSAGSIGFNRQATNNQSNQQGQNNNSPSSPPASPASPASPSSPNNTSNSASTADNSTISSASNQINQNSQVEPTGNGQIDDTVPKEFASVDEYKARLVKLHKNFLDSLGIKLNEKYPLDFATKINRNKVKQKAGEITLVFGRGLGIKDDRIYNALLAVDYLAFATSQILFGANAGKVSFREAPERFEKSLNLLIQILEKAKPKSEPSKFDDDLGTTATPTIGGNPTPGTGSSPNQPGGRGNNPSPRGPGSNPTPTAKPSNPSGLSDKEKNFFANQEKDKNTNFDEAKANGLEGFKLLRPDQAVTPNQPKAPDLTDPDTAGQAPNQPVQAPTLTNQNRIEIKPQFVFNLPAKSGSSNNNIIDPNKVAQDLTLIVEDVGNIQGNQLVAALFSRVKDRFDQMFS